MKYKGILYSIYHWLASIPPKVQFRTKDPLTPEEKREIINRLASGYYIILTGNNYHLSSLAVKFMSWVKTGTWSRYSHALMNCDYLDHPADVFDFKFMEATVSGVHYSTFEEVFDCDSVCLLSPANMDNKEWSKIIDALVKNKDKPYDDLFQLADDTHISCVELVRDALKADGSYDDNFGNLEYMIQTEGNLLPQMFRDCPDFIVFYETK